MIVSHRAAAQLAASPGPDLAGISGVDGPDRSGGSGGYAQKTIKRQSAGERNATPRGRRGFLFMTISSLIRVVHELQFQPGPLLESATFPENKGL
jgi:hypothetical protein